MFGPVSSRVKAIPAQLEPKKNGLGGKLGLGTSSVRSSSGKPSAMLNSMFFIKNLGQKLSQLTGTMYNPLRVYMGDMWYLIPPFPTNQQETKDDTLRPVDCGSS